MTNAEHAAAVPRSRTAVWWGNSPSASASVSSTQAVPKDKQAWNSAAASEFSSPTLDWGTDLRPPGGFLSYFENPSSSPLPQQQPNQQAMFQNLHYAGGPPRHASFPAPRPTVLTGNPVPPFPMSSTPLTPSGSQQSMNVDGGGKDGGRRTEKRLAWTKEEDTRLMSAWLSNSTDPINGNNKKSDQYWGDVTMVYNSTTPENRKRLVKQAKDHWHSLNKLVYQFHCSYTKASAIYASGQSDAQLLEKAHAFYEADYKAQFHHMDCWRAVNEFLKWRTYNEWPDQTKKRKTSDSEPEETGKDMSSHADEEDIPHPIGTKAAKAEHNGKGKSKQVAVDMELLEKLAAAQAEAKKTCSDRMEMEQRLSTEKLETARLSAETARLSALAAKDNIEARK